MKMKRNMKRIVSGLLAAVTILSGALSPFGCLCCRNRPGGKEALGV
ncbi:MAG: hypothetical protein ACLU6Y_13050 [Ruminococcus sp.]